MEVRHIAFACSGSGGLKDLAVAVLSLFDTFEKSCEVKLHILWSRIEDHDLQKLQASWSCHLEQISFYDMIQYIGEEALHPKCGYWFRTRLGEVLAPDINRVLYIDCDTLIYQDLSSLWDIDISDYAAAVVWDSSYRFQGYNESLHRVGADLGYHFPKDAPYFNSGVLFINLTYWREHSISEQIDTQFKGHRGRFRFHDQDELNLFLQSRVLALPPSWNLLESINMYQNWDYQIYQAFGEPEIYFQAKIRHFAGSARAYGPFGRQTHKMEFYAYLDQTEWAGWRSASDQTWRGKIRSQLLDLHYYVYRGLIQKSIPTAVPKLKSLVTAKPYLLALYPLIWVYRLMLKLNSKFERLFSLFSA